MARGASFSTSSSGWFTVRLLSSAFVEIELQSDRSCHHFKLILRLGSCSWFLFVLFVSSGVLHRLLSRLLVKILLTWRGITSLKRSCLMMLLLIKALALVIRTAFWHGAKHGCWIWWFALWSLELWILSWKLGLRLGCCHLIVEGLPLAFVPIVPVPVSSSLPATATLRELFFRFETLFCN